MRVGWKHKRPVVRGKVRRRRLRVLGSVLVVLVFVHLWNQALIGHFLRVQVNRWLLPRTVASERVTLRRFTRSSESSTASLMEGVQLTISPAWAHALLRASPVPGFLLPPGFLVDGLMTSGSVAFPQADGAVYQVPFYLQIREHAGLVPELQVRFPATSLNFLLDAAFAEDWTDTGDYLLGSYDLEQRIRFDQIRITTLASDATRPMFPLILRGTATGQLRYRFRDGWFRARVTARVRDLQLLFVLIPVVHPDGIGFDYRARIENLELRVRRMPRWVERRLASRVRSSLERSLNHRRKRERLAHRRLPLWLPLDLALDVEIVNPPDSEDAP